MSWSWLFGVNILRYMDHSLNIESQICFVFFFQKRFLDLQFYVIILFPCFDFIFQGLLFLYVRFSFPIFNIQNFCLVFISFIYF